MKLNIIKIPAFILLFFTALNLSSQIPNASFETWDLVDSILAPTEWTTSNFGDIDNPHHPVSRTESLTNGSFAMKVRSTTPFWEGLMPGLAYVKVANFGDSLNFDCQILANSNNVRIGVSYFQPVLLGFDSISSYWESTDTLTDIIHVSIPINPPATMDSIYIIVSANNVLTSLGYDGYTEVVVDNFYFSNTQGTTKSKGLINDLDLKISPNPASDIVHIDTNTPIGQVSIYTIGGTLVTQSSQSSIDVSMLSRGIYFVAIQTATGVFVRKLKIN